MHSTSDEKPDSPQKAPTGGIAAWAAWRGVPVVLILSYYAGTYFLAILIRLRGDLAKQLGPELVAHFGGVVLAAILLGVILRRFAGRHNRLPARAARRWTVGFLLFALPPALVHFFLFDQWLDSRLLQCLLILWFGFFHLLAHTFFFLLTPSRKSGFWFGMCLTTAMAATWCGDLGLDYADPEAVDARMETLFHLVALFLGAVAATLALAAFRWSTLGLQKPDPAPLAERPGFGRAARLLLTMLAFYIMNAMLQAKFFPFFPNAASAAQPPETLLGVALCCPLVGWLYDRNGAAAFRTVMRVLAVVFLLAPFLAVLTSEMYYTQRFLYAFLLVGKFVIYVIVMTALAGAVGRHYLLPAALGLLYLLNLSSFAGLWLFGGGPGSGLDLVVLANIAAALVFYFLADMSFIDPPGEREPAAPPAANQAPPDPLAGVQNRDRLFQLHSLTPRESDVAIRLIQGMRNRDIADQLSISENTVATHVKGILRKFDVPSRNAFQTIFIDKALSPEQDLFTASRDSN